VPSLPSRRSAPGAGGVQKKKRRLVLIRPYERQDWDGVWAILEPVFRAGETNAIPVDISEEDARREWTSEPKEVFVAVDQASGQVVGTYYVKPNHEGPGAHVCNCGYVVSEKARGRGIAAQMCEHSQREAVSRGYRAMQFNLVVASNERAVRLWRKLGFDTVGTLPGAFRHSRLGFVDAYVMYKRLGSVAQEAAPADAAPPRGAVS
jgi:ribosomal protein S18 acetylase RimI-like enzyme